MKPIEPKLVFPGWGNYGVRVELKPPNEAFKNPKLMISEVKKDEASPVGWKFYMRGFNEAQKTRGYYNAHCSIPVDSLPSVIAALVEIWNEVRPDDADELAEGALEVASQATAQEGKDLARRQARDMSELAISPTAVKQELANAGVKPAAPAPVQDPWDMIRKKKGGPALPDQSPEDSDDKDDVLPF